MQFQRCTESNGSITIVNLVFPNNLDLLSVVTGQNESHSNVIEQLLLIICLRQNSEANWEKMFLT